MPRLHSVSDDVIGHIISFLYDDSDVPALLPLLLVNKRWKELVTPFLHRRAEFSKLFRWNIENFCYIRYLEVKNSVQHSKSLIERVTERCSGLRSLYISATDKNPFVEAEFRRNVSNLIFVNRKGIEAIEIHVPETDSSPEDLSEICYSVSKCSRLRLLSLCNLTDLSTAMSCISSSELRVLEIEGISSEKCASLESFQRIARMCPRLQSLTVKTYQQRGLEEGISLILPQLRLLRVGCFELSYNRMLKSIYRYGSTLNYFYVLSRELELVIDGKLVALMMTLPMLSSFSIGALERVGAENIEEICDLLNSKPLEKGFDEFSVWYLEEYARQYSMLHAIPPRLMGIKEMINAGLDAPSRNELLEATRSIERLYDVAREMSS